MAAIASVLCGFMVAGALGAAPSWTGEAIGAVLVAATVIVLASGSWRRRHAREAQSPAALAAALEAARAHDAKVVSSVFEILRPNDVNWLRTETFAAPWRSARITPFRSLSDSEQRLDLPLEADVETIVRTLMDSVRAFLELYDTTTSPELFLLAGDWQEVKGAQVAKDGGTEHEAFHEHCEELRTRAHAVALAYNRLSLRSA